MIRRGEQGAALALLLVMLAALSLLVLGLSTEARTEARLAQVFVQRAEAAALAEGATYLALRDMLEGSDGETSALRHSYRLGGRAVAVEIVPEQGLLSVTRAPVETLAALLRIIGGLSPADAEALAEGIAELREPQLGTPPEERRKLSTLEDLLFVPGMQRAVYERIAPLITVSANMSSVDPMLAPEALLPVLAAGDRGAVADWQQQRSQREIRGGAVLGGALSVRVAIDFEDGARITRRIEVAGSSAAGFPWRIRRAYPVLAENNSTNG